MPAPPLPQAEVDAFRAAYERAVAEGHAPRGAPVGTGRRAAMWVAAEMLGITPNQAKTRCQAMERVGIGGAAEIAKGPIAAPFVTVPTPSGDEPIEDLIARRAAAYARRHEAKEANELLRVAVQIEGAYGILHMGDPHVDDDGCDWPTLLRHIELIDKTEGLFAANVGDLSNNWVGRLARLYASQGTTAGDAWRMVEWLINRVRWLYIIGGNHDAWSGAADPVRWFAAQAGVNYQWHGMRLALKSPNGAEVRVNARHDFAGTSQWNGAHAPAKAARMGWARDHIYTCGHRHMAAHATLFFNNGEHVAHAIRCGAYKVHDDFAESKGFPKENMPAAATIINPNARTAAGLVTVFWDVEEAAAYLTWLRRPRVRVQAGRAA